jgi:hypothetical protein
VLRRFAGRAGFDVIGIWKEVASGVKNHGKMSWRWRKKGHLYNSGDGTDAVTQ